MSRKTTHAAFAALALWAGTAVAAPPAVITYSGFLTDAGGTPTTGAQQLTFRFWDATTAGTMLGAPQILNVVAGSDGYFSAVVPITVPDLFEAQVYMEVQFGAEAPMTPRIPITSVPSALAVDWSGISNRPVSSCDGALPFVTGVAPDGVLTCAAAPAGAAGCATGQILRWNGSTWACVTDQVGTVTSVTAIASGGVTIAGTSAAPTVGLMSCANGQVLKAGATAGTWACGSDLGTVTSISAGTGLVSSTGGAITTTGTLSANLTASGGDNGAATSIARGDHVHDARYYTESELSVAGTINSASNPVDWTKLKNVPAGTYAGSRSYAASGWAGGAAIPASGGNLYVFPLSYTPPWSGYCQWTARLRIFFAANPTVANQMECAYKIGAGADSYYGAYSSMYGARPAGWSFSDSEFTYSIAVTAGTTYQFGCHHTATTDSAGRSNNCYVSLHCTPN